MSVVNATLPDYKNIFLHYSPLFNKINQVRSDGCLHLSALLAC